MRQIRHFNKISLFVNSIEYLKGSENKAADYLSRLNACVVNIPDDAIDYKAMAEVPSMDQELHELQTKVQGSSLVFSSKYIPECRFPLIGDVSTGIFRPFVPGTMREKVIASLHQLSHPGAIPIKGMKSETCIQAILYNWIALFGVPKEISADRGKSFDSISWNTMCRKLGINMIRTTSYHPSANGAIEGLHRTLKLP
ncbi:uncharacterized protein LOC144750171 [Ciona intestinalis]